MRPVHTTPDQALRAAASLAGRLRRGDPGALGPWYSAEYPIVHRLCLGLLAEATEADDAAQDAMLHLHDQIERWDPKRNYEPWRASVVLNLCRDRLRRNERRSRHERTAAELRFEKPLPDPSDQAAAGELAGLLQSALKFLAPREREAFVLIDLQGLTAMEVAEATDLSASTIRGSLSLARRRLRDLLSEHLPAGFVAKGDGR